MNKKLRFRGVRWPLLCFFALLLALGSCSSCDPDLVQKQKLFADLQFCSVSYQDQMPFSEERIANAKKLSCFEPDDIQAVDALLLRVKAQLPGWSAKYANQKLPSEKPKVIETVDAAAAEFRTLANDYQQLQEYLAYCRTNHILAGKAKGEILENGTPGDQDKLFLHVLGDIFGKDSGFEGFEEYKTLIHRKNALTVMRDQLNGQSFIKDHTQTRPCKVDDPTVLPKGRMPYPDISQELLNKLVTQAENAMLLTKVFSGDLSEIPPKMRGLGEVGALRALLRQQLEQLQPGESIFLPAGWSKHAVFYQFTKEKSSDPKAPPTFTFRIFNSGEGINTYHTSSVSGYKAQFFPFVDVRGVSFTNISGLIFLKSLKEIAAPTAYKTSPQDFYEKLLMQTEGQNQEIPYGAELFEDPQNAGTCTYFATPWVLSSSTAQFLDGDKANADFIPDQIEFLINLKTLRDYTANREKEGLSKLSDERLNLLKKGFAFFAEQALNGNQNHAVDGGSLAVAAAVGERIEQKIVDAEAAKSKTLADKSTKFKAENVAELDTLEGFKSNIAKASLISASAASVYGETFDFSLVNWKVPENKDVLLNQLGDFYAQLKGAINYDYLILAIDGIQQISLALPLDEKWWKNTTERQAQEFIDKFARYDELYLYALLMAVRSNVRPVKQVSAIELTTSIKFLTLGDLLSHKLPDNIPSMYQKLVGKYLHGDLSIFETADPRWQWQIKLLRDYYQDQQGKQVHDFFGFNEYPSAIASERRIYYDPKALNEYDDQHWSAKKSWRDVDWAVGWIKRQHNYRPWLEQEMVENEGRLNWSPITPWEFECRKPSTLKPWPSSITCTPSSFTPIKRVERPNVGEDILARRLVVNLLGKNKKTGKDFKDGLPQAFYDLRTASIVTDYLLTSTLVSTWTPDLSKGIGQEIVNNYLSFETSDARRQCTCNGMEDYWDEEVYYDTVTTKEPRWNSRTRGYDYVDVTQQVRKVRHIQRTRPATKPGSVIKSTTFRYADLELNIFGKDDYKPDTSSHYAENERIELAGPKKMHASPYLHLKNSATSFKKFETDPDDPKWHYKELLKIFTTGLDDDSALLKPDKEPTRRRYQPNLLILKTPVQEGLPSLSLERMRSLLGLSGVKEEQVIQTLAYFTKNAELLAQPVYQRLFEKLMKEPSLILDELAYSDHHTQLIVDKLARFCNERFLSFKRYGDYRGMAFALHMNQFFENQVEFARSVGPDGVEINKKQYVFKIPARDKTPKFLNTPEVLLDIIQKLKAEQQDEKSFLYRNMVEAFLYRSVLSKRDVELLLLAVIEHNAFMQADKRYEDKFAENSIKNILTDLAGPIRKVMISDTRDLTDNGKEILDFIVKHTRSDLQGKGAWRIANSGPPVLFESPFVKPKATIQINIAEGRIFDAGKSRVLFPITQSDYEKVFGDVKRPEHATEISYGQYQWVANGRDTRARRDTSGWVVQQEVPAPAGSGISSNWYQFMQEGELQGLVDSKAYFAGHDYWKSLTPIDGKTQIRVVDSATKDDKYIVTFTPVTFGAPTPEVTRVADGAKLIEVDKKASAYGIFQHIESWRYVYIWSEQKSDGSIGVKEVELPRWGLRFAEESTSPGKSSLICGKWNDYVVAVDQFSLGLGAPSNYLVCEAKDGSDKRMALLPLAKPSAIPDSGGLLREFTHDFSTDPGANSVFYLTYNMDPLSPDGLISAPTNTGRYYLALRFLWQQKYRLSIQQINAILSSGRKLNKRETNVLQWMAEGNDKDNDPRASAVRLRAEYELIRNAEVHRGEFEFDDDSTAVRLGNLYGRYVQRVEHVDRELLGLREEERIATRLLAWLLKSKVLKEFPNAKKMLENRLVAIQAELKKESFVAEIDAVSPTETSLVRAASLVEQGIDNVFPQLETSFLKTGRSAPPVARAHALDAASIVGADNFGLLYSIVAGDAFDMREATSLLRDVLGDGSASGLTQDEIRQEFLLLLRMASLVDKKELASDPLQKERQNARLLVAVAEAKKAGATIRSHAELVKDFRQYNDNTKTIERLQIQIEAKNRELSALYTQSYNLPYPRQWHNDGSKNWDYDDEMLHRNSEIARIDAQKAKLNEIIGSLNSRVRTLESDNENSKQNLFSYFQNIQTKDVSEHRIVVTPIKSGKITLAGQKEAPIKQVSPEILNAPVPIEGVAQNDPLKTPIFAPSLFISGPSQVIAEHSLNDTQKKAVNDAAEALNRDLERADVMRDDVKKAVKELRQKITQRAVDVNANKKSYGVANWPALENVSSRLKGKGGVYENLRTIPDTERDLRDDRERILQLGRKYASKLEGGAYTKLLRFADVGQQPTLNDLIYLLMKRNLVVFYEQSSGAHDLKELNELYERLVKYLMLSTYVKHAQRVADAIDIVVKKRDSLDPKSSEFQQLLENMVSAGREVRHYNIATQIEFLIFEHFMGILLRETQVAALDKLKIKDGKIGDEKALGGVLEMIMGAGKTSVLLPLLSALDVSGEWLNVVILPEALVASMSEELADRLGRAFSRGVTMLSVSRQRYLKEPDLALLYDGLVRARIDSRTVITTNSAVQSLFLSFIDRLSRYEKDKNQVSKEIEYFVKIFRFLRQYARLTIDEVDLALDILQAHQFSVGDPISLMKDKDKVLQTLPATVISLYHLIATNPKLYKAVDLPFLPYSRGSKALTATSYQEFKKLLLREILEAKPFFFGFKDLNVIFRDFVEVKGHQELVKDYLLAGTMANRDALFAQVDRSSRSTANANRLKDILTILYDELNIVFELSATKKLGVHYGPLPIPMQQDEESEEEYKRAKRTYLVSRYVAIPYHSGEPMVNSRFGTPVEALNYTVQMALERRDYRDIVQDELEMLKTMADKGAAKSRMGRFEERFEKLVGKDYPYPIGSIGPKQIADIAKNLGKKENIVAQFDLVSRYVAPQVTVYPMQLQTNAQVYEALFRHVQGFTGTLWSVDTFPKIFRKPERSDFSDTTEKTFFTLWQDNLEQRQKDPSMAYVKPLRRGDLRGAALLQSLVDQIYTNWDEPGSFMDEAGVFRAFDNVEVVKAILDNANVKAKGTVLGVIFYDSENNLKMFEASGAITDLALSQVPFKGRVAFWDKKHTTGSDLKLRADMQAKIAVDHHTTSRGLQQTVFRMRGLGAGQRVVQYFALDDDLDIIKKRLTDEWHMKGIADIDVGELILYAVVNQETRLGELRYRAVKQKMKNVVVRRVLDEIFGAGSSEDSVDVYKIGDIYGSVRKLFEATLDKDRLYMSMGMPKHELDVDEALKLEQKYILRADYTKALNRGAVFSESESYKYVETEIEKLKKEEEPLLPRRIVTSNFDVSVEVEIELELEQEEEREEEQEQELEQYYVDPAHKKHDELFWSFKDPQRVFKRNYFAPVSASNLGYNPSTWLYNQDRLQPLISLPDALVYKSKTFLANAFDKNIFLSLNLAPLHHRNIFTQESRYEYEFFSVYDKYPGDVLVIQDRDTGDIRFVLLDLNDVKQWDQFLGADVSGAATIGGRDVRVALYNINFNDRNIYRDSADAINEDALKRSPQFLKLIVQVKFFAGNVSFSKEEEPELRHFLEGPGTTSKEHYEYARKMLDIFRGEIHKLRHDSSQSFRGSDLEAVFESILGSLD